MVASEKPGLPPSARAFDVYQLVSIEGVSTRQAAAILKLSQTRIVQLRDAVIEWIAAQIPAQAPLTKDRRLAVAEHQAVERLEFLYRESVLAWEESKGEKKVERSSLAGGTVTITQDSQGKTGYLQQAVRLAVALGRHPMSSLYAAGASEETAADGDPSEEDCSPDERFSDADALATAEETAEDADETTTCGDHSRLPGEFLRVLDHAAPTVQSVLRMPEQAPDSTRKSSRRERRARQRELERALKKAR